MKLKHLYLALILSFILGVRDGNIALWKKGAADPVRIFPYRADTLPLEAQQALQHGIPIHSIDQLEALAENYLS